VRGKIEIEGKTLRAKMSYSLMIWKISSLSRLQKTLKLGNLLFGKYALERRPKEKLDSL